MNSMVGGGGCIAGGCEFMCILFYSSGLGDAVAVCPQTRFGGSIPSQPAVCCAAGYEGITALEPFARQMPVRGHLTHKKHPHPRTIGLLRLMPRALGRSWGGGGVLMSE